MICMAWWSRRVEEVPWTLTHVNIIHLTLGSNISVYKGTDKSPCLWVPKKPVAMSGSSMVFGPSLQLQLSRIERPYKTFFGIFRELLLVASKWFWDPSLWLHIGLSGCMMMSKALQSHYSLFRWLKPPPIPPFQQGPATPTNSPKPKDALRAMALCTKNTIKAQSFRKPKRSLVKISREKKPGGE